MILLVGSVLGLLASRTPVDVDQVAARLDSYTEGEYKQLYNFGTCFGAANGSFDKSCLRPSPDKSNVLLWGDSLAAHYVPGLREVVDPLTTNLMQATQPGCMPTLSTDEHGIVSCIEFARRMRDFFSHHRPDIVVISGDWLEYSRRGFELIIADLKKSIAQISGSRVIVLGPAVQFKARLPAMLLRAHFRGVEVHSEDLLLPGIFELDQKMGEALPESESFSYVSVLDGICPNRQCPLTIDDQTPLTVDHAHLTADGSAYVSTKLLPELGLKRKAGAAARIGQAGP